MCNNRVIGQSITTVNMLQNSSFHDIGNQLSATGGALKLTVSLLLSGVHCVALSSQHDHLHVDPYLTLLAISAASIRLEENFQCIV